MLIMMSFELFFLSLHPTIWIETEIKRTEIFSLVNFIHINKFLLPKVKELVVINGLFLLPYNNQLSRMSFVNIFWYSAID